MTAAVFLVGGKAIRLYRGERGRSDWLEPGRGALLLSGGGNLGFFHLGVAEVLLEHGILPRVLSGASAGATMAALIGTRSERELDRASRHQHGLASLADRQIKGPVTSESVRESLDQAIPDVTFAEAHELSGRAINISVSSLDGRGGLVCGPLTTPDVLVRDAVLASCAVPRVFEPVALRQRRGRTVVPFRPGQRWIDGSIFADVPSGHIKRHYGVRHTIVSMVNPMARPFLADDEQKARHGVTRRVLTRAFRTSTLGWLEMSRACAVSVPRIHDAFDTAWRMVRQDYSGDLMVTPARRFAKLRGVMDQPTDATIRALAAEGAERTRARLGELMAMAA